MNFRKFSVLFFCCVSSSCSIAQSGVNEITLLKNNEYQINLGNDLSISIKNLIEKDVYKQLAYSNAMSYVSTGIESKVSKFLIFDKAEMKELNEYGNSNVFHFKCYDENRILTNDITITAPENFQNTLIFQYKLKNNSNKDLSISKVIYCNLNSDAKNFGAKKQYEFWSFQPESTPERAEWIKPVTDNDYHRNFQGMNAPDYGGGIPLIDLWTKNQGIAISSLSLQPEFINFPLQTVSNGVRFGIEDSIGFVLKPNEELSTIPFAIILHKGDFFNALRIYSDLLQLKGIKFNNSQKNSLEPEWCAWGYGRNFNKEQILKSLDEVVSLGLKWVTIDDGWQSADGDWNVNQEKFKGGQREFKSLVDSIHSKGLKARLWWVPLTANDSAYNALKYPERLNEFGMTIQSNLAKEHPDWFILDKQGKRYQVSWWNSFQLCPALTEVREYYKTFIKRAISEWGFDGFKIDGQNLNLVPACYNPAHHHSSPYDAPKATPLFLKDIYETAKNIKPDFLIQICPCGTNYNVYNLPYVDQVVASDPLNSDQVRIKGKTFKALFGNKLAYSGDHVELSNRKWDDKTGKFVVYQDEDFLSTIGIGGVPSTKFTNQNISQSDTSLMLTEEKKNAWKRWVDLYNDIRLSEGEYINLYDIAFDKPETHLIKKGNDLYYSLFDESNFTGLFNFRGLEPNVNYEVNDIVIGKKLGTINCKNNTIEVSFNSSTILKVNPAK